MSFLNKYINTDRKEKANVTAVVEESNKDDAESIQDNGGIDVESESATGNTETCQRSTLSSTKKQAAATVLQEYLCFKQNRNKTSTKNDALHKYFDGVEETVRTFPYHLHIQVKSQVSNIIHNAEYKIASGAF